MLTVKGVPSEGVQAWVGKPLAKSPRPVLTNHTTNEIVNRATFPDDGPVGVT